MAQINNDMIADINQSLDISIPTALTMDELQDQLAAHINYLVNHDFEKLVYYLYRIDVDESKMRKLLEAKAGENTAGLIANLIIERQLQKIESRRGFNKDEDISDEEKW
jgi:hypothetical protein